MEVSHTLDGYWVLAGWIDTEHEDAQAIMKQARKDFIKTNPLIDPSKVVVVNGEFKQASFKQPTLADLARTDECQSLTNDLIAFMANGAKVKAMLGDI